MKHYQWVKDEIEKLLAAKVIHTSQSSWSAPIIVVPKGDGRKMLSNRLQSFQQSNQKIHMAHAKSRGHFF